MKILFIFVLITFLITFINCQPTFSDNCLKYNLTYSVCQQCNPGFYLQYFFCVPCNPRCSCSWKDDYCQSCLAVQNNGLNFYSFLDQVSNQCKLCSNAMPYCLQCTDLQHCTKCYNGQYLVQDKDKNGTVIKQYCSQNICTSNCQFCQDSSHCKLCQEGYFLFPNKTCSSQPCGTNCSLCQSIIACQVCMQGYYLSSSQCQLCTANCSKCTTATNCQLCSPSYNLVNGTCTPNNLANCIQYANSFQTCTGCQPGYQVTAGSCNSCTGCQICNQQFICLSPCLPGYQPFNFACISSFENRSKIYLGLIIIFTFLIF